MNPIVKQLAAYALARAKESSTWIGLITLIAGQYAHVALTQNQTAQIAGVAVALVGAVVALFPQSGVVGQVAAASALLTPGEPLLAALAPLVPPTGGSGIAPPPPAAVSITLQGGAGKGPASYE